MKRFLVSYRMDGSEWNIELPAKDFEDAHRRLGQLHFARVDGELICNVPSALGPFAALAAVVRNYLSPGR